MDQTALETLIAYRSQQCDGFAQQIMMLQQKIVQAEQAYEQIKNAFYQSPPTLLDGYGMRDIALKRAQFLSIKQQHEAALAKLREQQKQAIAQKEALMILHKQIKDKAQQQEKRRALYH